MHVDVHKPQTPTRLVDEKDAVETDDVLVFQWESDHFRLSGGTGRGAGWANIVEVALADNTAIERAWNAGVPVRISGSTPVRIAGPYWTSHAVIVPVGQAHLVVFGSTKRIASSDAALFGAAAGAVSDTGGVSAEKLLADELEVVHAVRALTSYQATNVRETARHIAVIAARALSCEVAAVRVSGAGHTTLEVLRVAPGDDVDDSPRCAGRDAATFLEAATALTHPMVEQAVGPDPQVWAADVVSRLTLPIGSEYALGALSLGHEPSRARGFTTLCQRIGRALAESAEPLLARAIAHEELAAERERLRLATETDSLTGIGNRTAWDAAVAATGPAQDGREHVVLSMDVDDLKYVNDHYGHAAGDALLSVVAATLRSTLRSEDVVTRVGGDEFLALLPNSGAHEARLVTSRIYRRMRSRLVTENSITPRISVGWATFEDDWATTVCAADKRMYAGRHLRRRAAQPQVGRSQPKR